MPKLTNAQWWGISDYASRPVPLREADLTIPFLYVRGYGVFYVRMGCHQIVSAYVFTWINDCEDIIELMDLGKIPSFDAHAAAATELTKLEGVAWLSNIGKPVIYANKLNHAERSYIKGFVDAHI